MKYLSLLVFVLFFSVFELSAQGQFNFIVTPESCDGCGDGVIDMTIPSCGTPDYLVSWTAPGGFIAELEDLSGLYAGEYCVSVVDMNGEEFSACVTVPIGGDVETITENVYCFESPGCNLCNCTLIYFNVNGQQPNGEACIQTPDCWSEPITYDWTDQYGYNVGTEACVQWLIGGNYQVEIESADGSSAFFVFYLDGTGGYGTEFEEECEPDGIEEDEVLEMSIFPNPSEGIFQLEITEHLNIILEVYSSLGELLAEFPASALHAPIDISLLPIGVYVLRVTSTAGESLGTQRLVLIK